MKRNVYWQGLEVYRNLFLAIIKPDNQDNVKSGYTKYIVTHDNNLIMCFACKNELSPYEEYLKRK